ncbi:MAG: thioredoxin domain-containing protein, partial [Betaproteobacteria bacterium]|nr:thioredoxin domain-containing protein [Betaproteobacteria bacterium]
MAGIIIAYNLPRATLGAVSEISSAMPNHLVHETSPYLQQHANNPVDWFPWGEEALTLAREQDKPILLSVGYSACHWCHVMAHESFEDPEVAAEMNRHFVNIKVDREERPDLDQIYQTAHAMLTQRSGGWPLTMFLMPDGTPFFGGTYFPKQPRYGMAGFADLLPRIADAYRTKREEIAKQNGALLEAFSRTLPAPRDGHELKRGPIDAAVRELAQVFDDVHGGIGHAPKFPHPSELAFCLRRHAIDGDEIALAIARLTLAKMAEGGIYDQLGGGFCRYSVDEFWTIPHFEKMLYDNGPLLALYADAWLATRYPAFSSVAVDTAAWVMREMQAPDGGYYSSYDADSEHEEGKFYVWTPAQAQALLDPDEYAVLAPHYGLDGAPNFEDRYWHLRIQKPLAAVARHLGRPLEECEAQLANGRAKLRAARAKRVWPGRDDKILVSWNALMIRGMARAARVFGEQEWLASAQRATDFIRRALWRDGRLLATYKDGKAHLNAYLDDHAFLLEALIELMQAQFRSADLAFAREIADLLLAQFEDRENGAFFFTSHDHEKLIHRAKPAPDGAMPSGNGIAAFALQRFGHIVGEPRYLKAAERTLGLFYPALERNPSAFGSLVSALEEWLAPPEIVVLRGRESALAKWRATLDSQYLPATLTLALPSGEPALPASLDKPHPEPGAAVAEVVAWVCR